MRRRVLRRLSLEIQQHAPVGAPESRGAPTDGNAAGLSFHLGHGERRGCDHGQVFEAPKVSPPNLWWDKRAEAAQ